jgi:hypothetical protein
MDVVALHRFVLRNEAVQQRIRRFASGVVFYATIAIPGYTSVHGIRCCGEAYAHTEPSNR